MLIRNIFGKLVPLLDTCTARPTFLPVRGVSSRTKPSSRRYFITAGAVATGLLSYEAYRTYYERPKELDPDLVAIAPGYLVPKSEVPKIQANRNVNGPLRLPELDLFMYQYQSCPFCSKVRAFLDYYGVSYNVVEVDPVLRQQTKFSKYRKVPILLVDRKNINDNSYFLQLNDSSLIVSLLSSYLRFTDRSEDIYGLLKYYQNLWESKGEDYRMMNKYFLMIGEAWNMKQLKKEENSLAEERFWREWADNTLVHVLSPNVYRTFDEALETFKHFSDVGRWEEYFPVWERLFCTYVGAVAMYFVSKRLKRKYALKGEVRESLYDVCRSWMKAVGKKRKFLGGDRPNLADLSVFGVLSSIEGCTAFNDLLANVDIGPWYYAVKEMCVSHAGAQLLVSTK